MYFLQDSYFRYIHISIYDLVLVPFIFAIVVLWGYFYAHRKGDALNSLLPWALAAKLSAVIIFSLIYMTVYAGDTLDYFNSAVAMNNVLFRDPGNYFKLLFNGNIPEYHSFFCYETGFPSEHMFRDSQTFFVVRLYSVISLIGGNSFIITGMIVSLLSLLGLWKLFRLFTSLYPKLYKYFFFSIILFPSALFWGSGILKDTITLSSTAWLTYCIFNIFFIRRKLLINVLVMFVLIYLIIQIKPYIFVSVAPGLLIWFFFNQVKKIKNRILRGIFVPVMFVFAIFGASMLISYLGPALGLYGDIDSLILKAKVTQEDLLRADQYGKNFYDIGRFESSPLGILKKAPAAIMAGMFRPFLWEARNPFVLLAGIENLVLLVLFLYIFIRVGPLTFVRSVIKDPLLTFTFVFSLLFAFGVGLASTNFGALVRYKIPMLPFLVSGLFIMLDHYKRIMLERAERFKKA